MFTWFKIWWLKRRIYELTIQVEMFARDAAVAAHNTKVCAQRRAVLEIQLIDVRNT